jgi:hypothetical protein
MSYLLPLAPLPWVLALLVFGFLSHARDHADFLGGPNMALAALCGLTLASYLVVNFTGLLSPNIAIGYLVGGVVLFAGAVGGIMMSRSL